MLTRPENPSLTSLFPVSWHLSQYLVVLSSKPSLDLQPPVVSGLSDLRAAAQGPNVVLPPGLPIYPHHPQDGSRKSGFPHDLCLVSFN